MQTRFADTDPPKKNENSMNKTNRSVNKIRFVFGAALLGALTGCVGYVDGPRSEGVYVQPSSVEVAVQDEYVYYPGYQVYYSSSRHQYTYRDGRAWVSRPAPPRVSADVLFASPSVRLGFHDSPAIHHAAVVRQYPKHWAPPKSSQGRNEGHDEDNRKGKKERD
ncbi:MAG TPA: hypothetical protein VN887_17510 [Candidatus Angelobacter sp.]|nr:hypothetical protein [Candidatus Angelobacter sp.]